MIRAGRLQHVIRIERRATTLNEFRVPTDAWRWVASPRAELVEASAEEAVRAHGADADVVRVFRIRYLEGVTVADRIVFGGVVHDLKGVEEIGRRRGLELRMVARNGR